MSPQSFGPLHIRGPSKIWPAPQNICTPVYPKLKPNPNIRSVWVKIRVRSRVGLRVNWGSYIFGAGQIFEGAQEWGTNDWGNRKIWLGEMIAVCSGLAIFDSKFEGKSTCGGISRDYNLFDNNVIIVFDIKNLIFGLPRYIEFTIHFQ